MSEKNDLKKSTNEPSYIEFYERIITFHKTAKEILNHLRYYLHELEIQLSSKKDDSQAKQDEYNYLVEKVKELEFQDATQSFNRSLEKYLEIISKNESLLIPEEEKQKMLRNINTLMEMIEK